MQLGLNMIHMMATFINFTGTYHSVNSSVEKTRGNRFVLVFTLAERQVVVELPMSYWEMFKTREYEGPERDLVSTSQEEFSEIMEQFLNLQDKAPDE